MEENSAQRDRLVAAGVRLFYRNGYAATGVREVAREADVPQGSFTNHFRAKDQFALLALNAYFVQLEKLISQTLENEARSPIESIRAYLDRIESLLRKVDCRQSCLTIDMASEVPAHSELLRQRVCEIMERQVRAFAVPLRRLCAGRGGIADDVDDLAAVLLAAWQGTLLRVKAERGLEPVARFRRVLEGLLGAERT